MISYLREAETKTSKNAHTLCCRNTNIQHFHFHLHSKVIAVMIIGTISHHFTTPSLIVSLLEIQQYKTQGLELCKAKVLKESCVSFEIRLGKVLPGGEFLITLDADKDICMHT